MAQRPVKQITHYSVLTSAGSFHCSAPAVSVDIVAFCRKFIAGLKVPRKVAFGESFKVSAGKIKNVLKDL